MLEPVPTTDEPAISHDREAQRERIIRELQRRAPEGQSVARSTVRRQLRILIPVEIALAIGALVVFYILGGPPAVVIGALLVGVYYLIGWGAAIAGSIVRRKERERMERMIERRLAEWDAQQASPARESPA